MIFGDSPVVFFFRVVNFAFIGTGIVYFFNTRILPGLRAQIAERSRYMYELAQQKQGFEQQCQRLEYSFLEQEQLIKELKKKLSCWSHHITRIHEQREQEYQQRKVKCMERIQVRMNSLHMHQVYQRITPEIIKRITQDLKEICETSEARHIEYMDRIVDSIKNREFCEKTE